ncbi:MULTISPECIES: acyltransferase [unclassified Alistipes]|jgi:peptidoglycan/LPS O-acetylase OafA/YrhL|uniref:acyltransferase family protein n=1 Tax=unclassified Alistipes TaxID=2608932 RepID=UPI000D0FBC87|nr:acyltransferase [Alistipes sp. Marseille-P5061]
MLTPHTAFSDSKPHYELLDGLRGVAALLVVWYHLFEAFATSPVDQRFNHGYLAVDFFFLLSGFVIGYAYDERWGRGLRMRDFIKRRLIRLHPMVVLGALLGAAAFFVQGSVRWNGEPVSTGMVLAALLCGLLLIPAWPGAGHEVRGNGEMYPLNGPGWSLFFEYLGNLLYMLLLRRLPTRWLTLLVALTGAALAAFAIGDLSGYGHLGVGWTLAGSNFPGGMLRLLFAFPAGLLLARRFRPVRIRGAFWLCSLSLAVLLAMPYVGSEQNHLFNGLYDTLSTLLLFPLLLWLGASGHATDAATARICGFLGDISYPLYMVHYPSMYLFYAWVWNHGYTFSEVWPVAAALFAGNILLAWFVLKIYDEPLRRLLTARFLRPRRQ